MEESRSMKPQSVPGELEDIVAVLQSVYSVTQLLLESSREGNLEQTEELLSERERLLDRAAEIREKVRSHPVDSALRQEAQKRIVPLLQAIHKENEKFVKNLLQNRKQTLEGLQQLQNSKSILAYAQ
jgi:uncharacterized protein (DUF1778 family)